AVGHGFAAGGRWFYDTDERQATRVHDLQTKETLLEASIARPGTVWGLSPDGRRGALFGPGETLRVVSLATGQGRRSLSPASAVRRAVCPPAGRRLAFATRARAVQVWDVVSGRLSRSVGVDSQTGLAWDDRGDWLAVAGWSGTIDLIEPV